MRKATLFWLGMAALCGTVLFHTSQEATDGRNSLRHLEKETVREEESLRVLKAEWSYLNQPERLEKLSRQYLELTPLHGRQFARLTDINEHVDGAVAAGTPQDASAIEPAAGTETTQTATPVMPAPAAVKSPQRRAFDDVMKSLGGQ